MSRVAVVTGSNKGIGWFTAIRIAAALPDDAIVYITARNPSQGEAAVETQKDQPFYHKLRVHQLDITDKASIDRFAAHLKSEHNGIDVLVNNAGFAFPRAATESFADQAKVTLRINYYGTRDVSDALLPLVRPGGRVVNVSSSIGAFSRVSDSLRAILLDPTLDVAGLDAFVQRFTDDIAAGQHVERGWPNSTYSVSKVAVSALTIIHSRNFAKNGILINAACPGWCRTDMAGDKAPRSAEEGADTPFWLATLPSDETITGRFFSDRTAKEW